MLALTGGTDGAHGSIDGLSLDDFCKKRTTTTTAQKTNVLAPCDLLNSANVVKLTGASPSAPGAQISADGKTGSCEYGPLNLGGAPKSANLFVMYGAAGAPAAGSYALQSAECITELAGVGDRAGVGAIEGGCSGASSTAAPSSR